MKGLKYVLLAFAVLSFTDSSAQRRRNNKGVEEVKTDTVSVDTFSYAIGMANTQGLQNYIISKMNVDPANMSHFTEGFSSTLSLEDTKRLQAYCAGLQIRMQVEQQIIPELNQRIAEADTTANINKQLFIKGFAEALEGNHSSMSLNTANEIAERQMNYYHDLSMERKFGENRKAGEAFLEENAKKDSVQVLPCGVQYKILKKGSGEVPSASSRVKVHYEGRLLDGTVFDSSYDRKSPTTFQCNQVIKGWTEALTHMPVGSKWELFIPQELAYGSREAGKIRPFSMLIFTVELLSIEK